jgi:membrane protease YdiL (CAAX protease family)
MKGKLTITGVNKVFFIFTIIFIAFDLILGVLQQVLKFDINIYVMLLINEFVIILIPCIVYVVKNKISLRETLGFKKLKAFPALIITLMSVPGYFVALALNYLVILLLQQLGKLPVAPMPSPQTIPQLIVGILVIAVSPAICEEFLHRGLLLRAYEKRGSYKAIIITSIFFGLFHMDITNFLAPIFWGAIFGYFALRTGSIFAGMLAHFLNNAIAELLQFFLGNEPENSSFTAWFDHPENILLLGVVCLAVFTLLFLLFKKVTNGKREFVPSISTFGKDLKSVFSHWPIIAIVVLYVVFFLLTLLVMSNPMISQ